LPTYVVEPDGNGGRRHWVAAAVFVALSIVLLQLPSGRQQQIASVLRATVLRPFVLTQEALAATRLRATESARLRAVLDSVVATSMASTTLGEENRRLRGLLSLSPRLGPSWIAASVIRAGTAGSESTFQLDVGSNDGVEVNAPVVTRAGLIGLVREVEAESALGMDWSNPEFRASAMSADGLTYGMIETERGDFREQDRLQFNGTAFHTDLPPGTYVLSSGLGVIPRGIPIGRIVGVAEEEEGWRRSYWLEPMVQPGSITHVLVATRPRSLPDDVSTAWPPDSVVTVPEMLEMEAQRLDSLAIFRDSIAELLEIVRRRAAEGATEGNGGRP